MSLRTLRGLLHPSPCHGMAGVTLGQDSKRKLTFKSHQRLVQGHTAQKGWLHSCALSPGQAGRRI